MCPTSPPPLPPDGLLWTPTPATSTSTATATSDTVPGGGFIPDVSTQPQPRSTHGMHTGALVGIIVAVSAAGAAALAAAVLWWVHRRQQALQEPAEADDDEVAPKIAG